VEKGTEQRKIPPPPPGGREKISADGIWGKKYENKKNKKGEMKKKKEERGKKKEERGKKMKKGEVKGSNKCKIWKN
jgi:hypothetical protein